MINYDHHSDKDDDDDDDDGYDIVVMINYDHGDNDDDGDGDDNIQDRGRGVKLANIVVPSTSTERQHCSTRGVVLGRLYIPQFYHWLRFTNYLA